MKQPAANECDDYEYIAYLEIEELDDEVIELEADELGELSITDL